MGYFIKKAMKIIGSKTNNIQINWKNPKLLGGIGFGLGLLFLGRKYFIGGACKQTANLKGKVVIVTGANTGIGKETARVLAKFGATVILACRDEIRTKPIVQEIIKTTGNQNVEYIRLDLADLNSISNFAETFKKKYEKLHILINNAGVMMIPKKQTTMQGFEMQFGVNHIGHFFLTSLLMDYLKKSAPSRIINLSSLANKHGHINFDDLLSEKRYNLFEAYSQSKLANVLFSRELNKRLEGTNVKAVSVHPGAVRTELDRYVTEGWFVKIVFTLFTPLIYYMYKNPLQGAQTSIYCAICDDSKLQGGEYYADCEVTKCNPEGKDDQIAKRLWEKTEDLIHVKFNI